MKVATWNISTTKNLPLVGQIIQAGASVICIQEVHESVIKGWDLDPVPMKHIFYGRMKFGRSYWEVIYWQNVYTDNGTMGLMVIWDNELELSDMGVYRYNAKMGFKSERRGLPWILLKNNLKIYSYHSTSSGDNKNHRNDVNREMSSLLHMSKAAVFGDFNMDRDYHLQDFPNELRMAAPNNATRISGRRLDYCVGTPNISVSVINVLSLGGSDHLPVLFEVGE